MFGSLGMPELLMIFAVALIVFGPRRLPEIGKTLGKALNEFKKATEDLKSTIEREVQVEETKAMIAPLITPATYAVSRAEPVTVSATPAPSEETQPAKHEFPSQPTPTRFES